MMLVWLGLAAAVVTYASLFYVVFRTLHDEKTKRIVGQRLLEAEKKKTKKLQKELSKFQTEDPFRSIAPLETQGPDLGSRQTPKLIGGPITDPMLIGLGAMAILLTQPRKTNIQGIKAKRKEVKRKTKQIKAAAAVRNGAKK